jgi:hypothetical protein
MMNNIVFKFEGQSFTITEIKDGKFDLNDLRKQIDNVEMTNVSFNSTQSMSDWRKYLSEKEVTAYEVEATRGRRAKTTSNKLGLVAYASWLNTDFKMAMEKVFISVAEGRDEDARSIAGDAMLDMDMVARVNKRWKVYVKWCYENFSNVNSMYGGNLTRMVISSATGVGTVSSVKGKVGEDYITKLANQGHGGAILAVNATLNLVGNTMRTSLFKNLLTTRGGKKEAYATLKEMLNWTDEFE